jgi:hypothetical protein
MSESTTISSRGDAWYGLEQRLQSTPELFPLLDALRHQIQHEVDTRTLSWMLYLNLGQRYFNFQRQNGGHHDDVLGAEWWIREPRIMVTLLRRTSRRLREVADTQFPGYDHEWCRKGYLRVRVRSAEDIPGLVARAVNAVIPDTEP